MRIQSITQLDFSKNYAISDYVTWKFDTLVELIKGKIVLMSPSPRSNHQAVAHNLISELDIIFRKQICKVFFAPFDVYLFGDEADKNTVVDPDICIICDRTKIKEKGCVGVPDLVVEILSLSTMKKDLNEKFNLYEEAGVKIYWVVHPTDKQVSVYKLNNTGKYDLIDHFSGSDQVPLLLWDDKTISCEEIFYDI